MRVRRMSKYFRQRSYKIRKANKLVAEAEELFNNGSLIESGIAYANAARLYDSFLSSDDAHKCEDKALWILRKLCMKMNSTDNVAITLSRIIGLAFSITEPASNAIREY